MLLTNCSNQTNARHNPNSIQQPLNILVLCTGNSARSVMAEGLLNGLANKYFHAYSAGSHPSGKVNPFALEQIAPLSLRYEARSKSWVEFAQADAVELDVALTVCDNAAQEICPHFIGTPKRIHWGLPDPAAVTGSDDIIRRAFQACYQVFEWRIQTLLDQLQAQPNADIF
jgi:arsenate reductase (thioredoxin)